MSDPEERSPPAQDTGYEAKSDAKRLLRSVRSGALATLSAETGHPFATLVNVATAADGSPLLLLSRLAVHSRNLAVDRRCSLLLAEGGKGDPLAHPRLTLMGSAEPAEEPSARARFLRRHPKASLYAGFSDFGLFRLVVAAAHMNGGFGRAAGLRPEDVLTDTANAGELIGAEEDILAGLNGPRSELLLRAARPLGKRSWRATGIDPEGVDLMIGEDVARMAFALPVHSPADLAHVLNDLAHEQR